MKAILSILFYLMMWLRKPFLIFGKFIAIIFFLGFLISAFTSSWALAVEMAVVSFIIFMLCQFYDRILLKINPTGNALYLSQ